MAERDRRARSAMMQLARDRFKQGQDADNKQAIREREDLRFYAGDQWPDAVLKARDGQAAKDGLPAIAARPSLVINKTREPVRQVLNQERQSDLGVELVPADDFEGVSDPIDETEIQLREGLIRRIQRESQAADARTWAFARAVIAGRGFYGVMTRFVHAHTHAPAGPGMWDQEVYVQRFYNQSAVTLDPAHEQPDGSDAEWGFVGTWMPFPEYKAAFPSQARKRNLISDANPGDFQSLVTEQPDWFKSEVKSGAELRSVYVTDYYYITRTSRELALLPDGSSAWVDELPDGATPEDTRIVTEKQVKWCKLDGANPEPLDETDWPGQYIPIIKVLGEELQPYDHERRAEGMVRPSRSSQEGFNAMVSKWVEMVGYAPLPPFQATPEQIEGWQAWYEVANTRALPWLPYNGVMDGGEQIGPPTRTPVSTDIAAVAGSVHMFDEAIQSTTGMHDPSLGRVDPSLKSARAIKEIVDRAQRGTSNYLDNLGRSIRYEGLIENDLLFAIYGRPGRLARIINGQGEPETVMLHRPFVMQGKRPVATPPAVPGQPPPETKTYTLTEHANFNVAIKVTRAFDTRRQEETATIGDLIQAEPQLMGWFGDLFFKHQDGPGHQEMADRAKVMLDPKIQAMLSAKAQGQDIPPQVQQQLAMGHQAIEQAKKEIDQLQQEKATDQAKYDMQFKIESMKADKTRELQIELKKMDNAGKIDAARITAAKQSADLAAEAEEERIALAAEQQHETAMGAADAGHEELMAQMGHQHALEAGAQGVAGQAALADQGQGHALEQQAMAPQPEAGA